jgi:TonB-dependent receptor
MDHLGESEGIERAGRVDLEYTFQDSDWLQFVRFGARVADRSYDNQFTGWNWGVISDDWNKLTGAPADPTRANVAWLDQFYSSESTLYTMKDFFGGKAKVPTSFWSPKDSMVDIATVAGTLGQLPGAVWSPIAFGPESANTQDERTQAGYGVLYFGNDALSNPVDGNVGVRVVKTSVNTAGGGLMPDMSSWADVVTQEVLDKYAGQSFTSNTSSTYTDVLPSLNLRVRFDHGLQWRFAASKAIARPEFRLMQAWLPLSASATACQQALDDGLRTELCGPADLSFTGNGGNPELKPMRATQFDTALEWYFGPANSLYATFFYKNVKDYFANQAATEVIFGDEYLITRPHNLDEGKIRGVEVGYSQFFDFLPGLGVQANYTYVDSSGGTNAAVGVPNGSAARAGTVELPLEGLSEHSYNLIGIYEHGRVSARLAYNWRSKYLLTSSDAITFLPTWNDDYGQLDGSFFYNINKNFQIGVQVNNLTNSITKLLVGPRKYLRDGYVDDTLYGRSWFENDRRYSAVLRASW